MIFSSRNVNVFLIKDNDFLEDKYKLILPTDAREKLLSMLRDDAEFLTRMHLMDYSLLVG